jgi:hypothetical protein
MKLKQPTLEETHVAFSSVELINGIVQSYRKYVAKE